MSRRTMFTAGASAMAGACAMAGLALLMDAAEANVREGETSANEGTVRTWYKLWEKKDRDWAPFDAILAEERASVP
jgi:hypothetical protein